MGLSTYNKKRDFKKTKEPPGKVAKSATGNRYLIQKHAASRLHYDFRLEHEGVLWSWAVPKGPSLSSADKRLAVQTEDHPLAYGDFEGTIPQGEYGGGTVMLWDTGTWESEGDAAQGMKKGKLLVTLNGKRLKGTWHLSRMHTDDGKANWLMIKSHDKYEKDQGDWAVQKYQTSVTTGRTMDEIAAGNKVWRSNRAQNDDKSAVKAGAAPKGKTRLVSAISKKNSKSKKFVFEPPKRAKKIGRIGFIEPQLATLHNDPPDGEDWIHEIKYDGYRVELVKKGKEVKTYTRRGKDWSERFHSLIKIAAQLPVENAIIDGELVVNNSEGISEFQLLQNALDENREQELSFYAFDLLALEDYDLRPAPLRERKAILKALVAQLRDHKIVQFSDHVEGSGDDVFLKSCSLHLEGIISKRADAAYSSGRTNSWLKSKCIKRQEFVIGGFVEPKIESRGVGALLLGYYENDELVFASKVGTGFNDKSGTALRKKLDRLVRAKPPFRKVSAEARRDAVWVEPQLVCEVEFTEWTGSGSLRHPSFIAMREDKPASEIRREEPHEDVDERTVELATARAKKRAAMKSAKAPRRSAPLNPDPPPDLELTSPNKVLYPDMGLTKLDLAGYYHQVAKFALPHLVNRPLSLVRCPEGRTKFCFFQRHIGKGTPSAIRTVPVEIKGRREEYLMIEDEEGLMGLVQIGSLEIHTWQCRSDDTEKPDRIIMDMDPDEGLPFSRVIDAAYEARERLKNLGLESYLKTTGGKGLHVVVPLARKQSWETLKTFAKAIAMSMENDSPDKYLSKMSKAARKGKIFVDYLRNEKTATAIGPYSTRSKANATVSVPLFWEELPKLKVPNYYNVGNVVERLQGLKSDPWKDMEKTKQSITQTILKKVMKDL